MMKKLKPTHTLTYLTLAATISIATLNPAGATGTLTPDATAGNIAEAAADRGQAQPQILEETDQLIVLTAPDAQAPGTVETVEQAVEQALENTDTAAEAEDVETTSTLPEVGESGAVTVNVGAELSKDEQEKLIAQLEADPAITKVEPDYLVKNAAAALPATASNSEPAWNTLWAIRHINANHAWPTATGKNIIIGVADTGSPIHAVDVATVPGYDFTDADYSRDGNGWDPNPRDEGTWTSGVRSSWHGTHVAGTAAASINGTGVVGVAPEAKVQHARVLGTGTNGYISSIAAGYLWLGGVSVPGAPVNTTPAQVINASMAWPSATCPAVLQSAINQLAQRNVPVVVAAGNAGANAWGYSPANCLGAIVVGASNTSNTHISYSNWGTALDLYAPGGAADGYIYSQFNTGATTPAANTWAYNAGTSMAAPHVAGTIALMKEKNRGLTVAQIRSILTSTATTGAGGIKVLNTAAAVAATPGAVSPQSTPSRFTLTGGIGAYYYANGAEGTFGAPTQNEFPSTLGGFIQNFSKGYGLYWTPQFGTHPVWWGGAIGQYYVSQRWELGWMGYPTSGEQGRPGGAVQSFHHTGTGVTTHVYWSPATGAQPMHGPGDIYHTWAGRGAYTTIGYPSTGEYSLGSGGVGQRFIKDHTETIMVWSAGTGTKTLNYRGAIYNHWVKSGAGRYLGFPVTDEYSAGSYMVVKFSSGAEIRWTEQRGAWTVR